MGICNFEAVVLAIDPALHTSGAVILAPDYGNGMAGEDPHPFRGDYFLHEFGKVTSQAERERYVTALLELSEELSNDQGKHIPPVIIAEEWDGPRDRRIRLGDGSFGWARDPRWTYQTIMGIGEGWGRWSAEIEVANEVRREEKISPDIILQRVLPNDWRDKVFGEHRAKDSETLKTVAVRYFKGVFGFDVSDDVAEAGCIGIFGLQSSFIASEVRQWSINMDDLMHTVEVEARAKRTSSKSKKRKR